MCFQAVTCSSKIGNAFDEVIMLNVSFKLKSSISNCVVTPLDFYNIWCFTIVTKRVGRSSTTVN